MHAHFPLPDINWEPTREFWAGAAREQLLITRCDTCSRYVWYPQVPCRFCGGTQLTWTPVSGRGTLFSWVVVHYAWIPQFRQQLPFVTALVALEEDPAVRVVSYIVDWTGTALRCDMPVRAVFRPLRYPGVAHEVMAPMFTPSSRAPFEGVDKREPHPSRRSQRKGPPQGERNLALENNDSTAHPEEPPAFGGVSKGAGRRNSTDSKGKKPA